MAADNSIFSVYEFMARHMNPDFSLTEESVPVFHFRSEKYAIIRICLSLSVLLMKFVRYHKGDAGIFFPPPPPPPPTFYFFVSPLERVFVYAIYACMCVYVCTHACIYVHIYLCMYVCLCMHTYLLTYVCIFAHLILVHREHTALVRQRAVLLLAIKYALLEVFTPCTWSTMYFAKVVMPNYILHHNN